jgi:3-oxoacyl-[acyl-carrier-protein] synthase III
MLGVRLSALGAYVPTRIVTNDDLSRLVNTSDEWIRTRTGIRERHIAADDETTSTLAAAAAARVLACRGLPKEAIEMVIVATMMPDSPVPAVACKVQQQLGLSEAIAFDIVAACSGFVFALETAAQFVRTGMVANALVIGAELLSRLVDWTDRSTCVLFGDAAGAALIEAVPIAKERLLGGVLRSDGSGHDLLWLPAGGTALPASAQTVENRQHYLKMRGLELYQAIVPMICESIEKVCARAGIEPADVHLFVPHQANVHLIEEVAGFLDLPFERFALNLDRYGNTSSASIPLALTEAAAAGRLTDGDLVLLVGFGAGLTCGASLMKWDASTVVALC